MNVQNEKEKIPFYCSWVFIVIVSIILLPVGLALVWKRAGYSRKTCLNLGMISMVFGAILMVMAIAVGYKLGDDYMLFCGVYGIIGVIFARMGYEAYKKSKIYRKILFEIEDEGVLMVPMIADDIGMPEIDVIKNLEAMSKKNLLRGYELAHNNKKLVRV